MLLSNDLQQDEAFSYLENAYDQKTLSTSYLFSGVRGLGKKELAFRFLTFATAVEIFLDSTRLTKVGQPGITKEKTKLAKLKAKS